MSRIDGFHRMKVPKRQEEARCGGRIQIHEGGAYRRSMEVQSRFMGFRKVHRSAYGRSGSEFVGLEEVQTWWEVVCSFPQTP